MVSLNTATPTSKIGSGDAWRIWWLVMGDYQRWMKIFHMEITMTPISAGLVQAIQLIAKSLLQI